MKSKIALTLIAALICGNALATVKPDPPKPETPVSTSTSSSQSGAIAAAGAKSVAEGGNAVAAGGDSFSASGALSEGSQAAANGEVNVGGDSTDYDAKALALGQIRAYAAPAVPGECRIHTRGWDVTVASATGGTKFEKDCVADQKCFRIVDIYLRLGRENAAIEQLKLCGGLLTVPVEAKPEPKRERDYFTREEQIEREKRMLERTTSK